jgi:hypothetical protein
VGGWQEMGGHVLSGLAPMACCELRDRIQMFVPERQLTALARRTNELGSTPHVALCYL